MASASDHYANLLARIYLWMAGGVDAALAQGAEDISSLGQPASATPSALDLGAGFGMHAIPLARMGYSVTAIDNSPVLLAELRKHTGGLDIRAVEADLRRFPEHVAGKADLILCMGDTITHLEAPADVERLFERIAEALAPAGRVVLTFRDYTTPLTGNARFIPVRSDTHRIHTCFLEEAPAHVVVHDLVYERQESNWTFHVSNYRKLRLSPEWVVQALGRVGLQATLTKGPRGILRIVAVVPASSPSEPE